MLPISNIFMKYTHMSDYFDVDNIEIYSPVKNNT